MTLYMREQEKYQEGRQDGEIVAVKKLIPILKSLDMTDDGIMKVLIKEYSFTEEKAKSFLPEFKYSD